MAVVATGNKLQIGQVLLDRGVITSDQIDVALEEQRMGGNNRLLGEILVDFGYCEEDQIASALAESYGVPYAQVNPKICDRHVTEVLPQKFLEEHAVLPLFKVNNVLTVALGEPSDVFLIDEINRLSGCQVQIVCATVKEIKATLGTYMPASNVFAIGDIIEDTSLDGFSLIETATEDSGDLEDTVSSKLNRKVKCDELISFTTQLSAMLDSGVVLSEALDVMSDQCNPGLFKQVLEDISMRITSGESFSSALSKYPKVFGTMFISMVCASEASGKMSGTLEVLSGYLTADAETRNRVKGTMIYPFVMLLMSIAAVVSLMFFVLPRFTSIYHANGASLPKLTQVLVSFSMFLCDAKIMTIAMTLMIACGFGIYYWRQTAGGQKAIDWIQIHLPIFGGMFIDSVLTRSMRIMSTMIKSGVSLADTLEVMKTSSGNYYFNRLWSVTDTKIRDGYQLSDSILLAPYSELVDTGIIRMFRAGEKSGQFADVCDKVSLFCEKKLQVSIRTATSLIEPVIIIIMGGVIGTIAIALLVPVFRISSVMSH